MSKLTIDELEVLTPDELGGLLRGEILRVSPDLGYIKDIIDVGYPIDARDHSGLTVLHFAVWRWHPEVVKFLISLGADIHIGDHGGLTAWDHAVKMMKESCPELEPK